MADFTVCGYEIVEVLGQNNYGGRITYKAIDLNNNKPVVIKQFQFLKDGTWDDYKLVEREIQTLQKLKHPAIPRYLSHFDSEAGICLVQEYKDARSLSVRDRLHGDRIINIASQILEILIYLQNIIPPVIHRDIKPDNILIDDRDNIYLVDFGFSRAGEESVKFSSCTAGTLGFMPPEQLHNLPLTKASDLYGLGVTLICAIAGIKSTDIGNLIDFNTNSLKFEHLMSDLSMDFLSWLRKTIEPDPKKRFPNAKEALTALQSISIARSPEIQFSHSSLRFEAMKFGEKQTQTLTIVNSVPETILEGNLQIKAHEKDPPHTPDKHVWISLSTRQFKANEVRCEITVDTSKLKPDEYYQRWLGVYSNSKHNSGEKHFEIQLEIFTAPESRILLLPYGYFLLSFVIALFFAYIMSWGSTLLNITNTTNIFNQLSGYASLFGIVFGVFAGDRFGRVIGIPLSYLLNSQESEKSSNKILTDIDSIRAISSMVGGCLGIVIAIILVTGLDFSALLMFSLIIIIVVPIIIIISLKTAEACRYAKNNISYWAVIILSRLIPACGIILGIGLNVGLSNPWVIAAIAATALPVATVIAQQDLKISQSKEKGKENYLIEP